MNAVAFVTIDRHARSSFRSPNRRRLVVAAGVAVVADAATRQRRKRGLALAECRLPNLPTPGPVRRDRAFRRTAASPSGRRIRIFAAVLPANTLTPKADPLLILAGGPGQAASTLAPFASRLNEMRRTRDVVLIDQRGTGRSTPLDCEAFKPRDDDALETDPVPRASACAERTARAGRGRGAVHDHRVDRRPRGDARRTGLCAMESLGRKLRHARRPGVSAPTSGPHAHR